MTQSRIPKALALILTLVALALLYSHNIASTAHARTHSQTSANSAEPPQQLSAEGQAALRAAIDSGNVPQLRWPDFSDYTKLVKEFYDSYGNALPWVRGMQPTAQAQQVIALLLHADQKGLSAEDYDGPRWADRLAKLKPATSQPSEADAVQFDVALTVCVMRYVSDLHIGKVNPKHFDFGLDVDTKKYDLPQFLKTDVVDAPDVAGVLAQVEPPYPGYQRTVRALQTYLQYVKENDGASLPTTGKTIAPGDTYPGAPQLIRLLKLVGDLPADANVPADATVFQGPLVDAVKHFQARLGRTPDGKITAQTLADLNVPLSARLRQMQLTLERWRWIPVGLHDAPIVANIPEFRLRAYDENFKVALTMNVVVGKAYGHDTPVFENKMQYVIFRPYWSVPYSIARAEFLPKIERDPDYLEKKGFAVVDSRQDVVASGAVSSDVLQQLRAGKLFIRQNPGPKNSLGLVKFIFPNSYDIYMHDTPEQELFAKTRRDFSHGCIRLEKPADLAVWVLRNNPGNWNMDHVRAAMNGSTTQQINLAHPIPILIVYGTAIVTEDGTVHFYDDIYGHDAELEKVLDKGYPYPG
ncbi:MAG: L,D-transpeptidase family protein [Candidatus Acidiferrales bacterium]|jgi:murein L,D-transpeptidase YcbB/YkuD